MSHEPYAELAPAYALGALEDDARVRFETHLRAGCPECEAEIRDYTEAMATLAAELPPAPPPPAVRARLLDRIAAGPPVAELARRPRPWRRVALWGGALAAAAAVVAYLGVTVAELRRELAAVTREAAELRIEVARQQDLVALLRAPDTQVIALAGLAPSPSARGRMWWQPATRRGFFVTAGLPPAPPGTSYQLWVISGGTPRSAGVFALEPDGSATLAVSPGPEAGAAEVFAVTLEPAGGRPAPSGPMYLAGKSP
jgi:anti-sigma-K factor RskA